MKNKWLVPVVCFVLGFVISRFVPSYDYTFRDTTVFRVNRLTGKCERFSSSLGWYELKKPDSVSL